MNAQRIIRLDRQERFAIARLSHPNPRMRERALALSMAAHRAWDRVIAQSIRPYRDF